MTFTIGCRWLDSYERKNFTVTKETAEEVLTAADGIEHSDARIEYVDTPDHGRLDIRDFRIRYGKRDQ
jgi:hypothetical protein